MTATGMGVVHTFRVSVYLVCVPPQDYCLHSVKLFINLGWYFLPLTWFIALFNLHVWQLTTESRYSSTLLLKIQWQPRPRSRLKLVKMNSRPYFQCVHHRLVPGKRHQRLAQLYIEFLVLTTCVHTGHQQVFPVSFEFLWVLYLGHTFTENR